MHINLKVPPTAGRLVSRVYRTIEAEILFEDVVAAWEFPSFIKWHESSAKHPLSFPFPRWQFQWRQWIESHEAQMCPVNDKREYYRETYLKSEHWMQLRRSVLSKSKSCAICLKTVRLDVHHRRYKNLFDVVERDLAGL